WQHDKATTWFLFRTQEKSYRKRITFHWTISLHGRCQYPRESSDYVYARRDASCDHENGWRDSRTWDSRTRFCFQELKDHNVPTDPTGCPTCNTCPCPPKHDGAAAGDPIIPATGEKLAFGRDIKTEGPHPLTFERLYRSSRVG